MASTSRPQLWWTLSVVAAVAAAVLGLASWVYAEFYWRHFDAEWLPLPEHLVWLTWLGVGLMLLGGTTALVLLLLRQRRAVAA